MRSVSDCCGATVTESPVCTPIGSTFSIEHTITTLSLRSRITSSSNSPQPTTDSSISTCPIGDAAIPWLTTRSKASSSPAKPPPCPPRVNAGRTISGSPMSVSAERPSASEVAINDRGTRSPAARIVSRKRSRSSARLIAS